MQIIKVMDELADSSIDQWKGFWGWNLYSLAWLSKFPRSKRSGVMKMYLFAFYMICFCYAWLKNKVNTGEFSTRARKVYIVSIGGSVVECSPATRAARVRFPADATSFITYYQNCSSVYKYTPKKTVYGVGKATLKVLGVYNNDRLIQYQFFYRMVSSQEKLSPILWMERDGLKKN